MRGCTREFRVARLAASSSVAAEFMSKLWRRCAETGEMLGDPCEWPRHNILGRLILKRVARPEKFCAFAAATFSIYL